MTAAAGSDGSGSPAGGGAAPRFTLGEIADHVRGKVAGDRERVVRGVAPFEAAGADTVTYAGGARFLKRIDQTGAGAVLVPPGFEAGGIDLVQVADPPLAFARVMALFHPPRIPRNRISPDAVVGRGFACGRRVEIGPGVVIGDEVTFGDRVRIHPQVVIGDRVTIGSDVEIYPHAAVLERCRLGNRVTVHAGTVIGSDGFGFAPDGEIHVKVPQTGIVQIDDDVEIGANNTIDRATFGRTWIQRGVKTDNLVHLAHNVTVGENTLLVAQVGVSGSVTIGRNVILAGQVGVAGHLRIGDGTRIGAQSGVGQTLPAGATMSGSPVMDHRLWLRVQSVTPRLPQLAKTIRQMEKRIAELESLAGVGSDPDSDC